MTPSKGKGHKNKQKPPKTTQKMNTNIKTIKNTGISLNIKVLLTNNLITQNQMIKFVVVKKFLYLFIISFLASCSIPEGEGGQGTISGRVFFQVIEDFTSRGGPSDTITDEYPAIDEKVYIKYGDNFIYDDDFDTDENGYFKFTNLAKGNYTLFTYTYCDSCDSEVSPIYTDVVLEKHSSEVENINFYITEED